MLNFFVYFTDPVLRAPTIGCMLICLCSALIGVLAFVRKRCLVSEVLSHTTYPGMAIASIILGVFFPDCDRFSSVFIFTGACISSLLGLVSINFLVHKCKVHIDAALCLILSVFWGIGLVFVSHLQIGFVRWYKKMQLYLYGQAATMTDNHIYIYGFLALSLVVFVILLYRQLEAIYFNKEFAETVGIKASFIEGVIFVLLIAAVIIGMRSVGIILMTGMLIAPAVAARQYTDNLRKMFVLAAVFGVASGFLGNFFSIESFYLFEKIFPDKKISLPIGPIIVLVAVFISLISLLFAPKRGLLFRFFRVARFKNFTMKENLLKKILEEKKERPITWKELKQSQEISYLSLFVLIGQMMGHGWIHFFNFSSFSLTKDGVHKAKQIIRLHFLWETYLLDYIGVEEKNAHLNAEEMEHILTPTLEKKILSFLSKKSRKDAFSHLEGTQTLKSVDREDSSPLSNVDMKGDLYADS